MQNVPRACVVAQIPSSKMQPSFSTNTSHSSPGIAVASISRERHVPGKDDAGDAEVAIERGRAGIAAARETRDVHPRRESLLAQREQQLPLGDDEGGDADVVEQHPAEFDQARHGARRDRTAH